MTSWLKKQLRSSRQLYAWLRTLKYVTWRYPLIRKLVPVPAEIRQLETIVRNSRPEDLTPSAQEGLTVLVFTPRAWSVHVARDLVVAHGLRMRGARVHVYNCSGRLPVCNIAAHHTAPPMPCDFCRPYSAKMFAALGFTPHTLKDFVGSDEIRTARTQTAALSFAELNAFEAHGLPLGKMVQISVRWFLNSGDIQPDDPLDLKTYRQFLAGAIVMAKAARQLLQTVRPDIVYLLNGLFFEEQILMTLARSQNIDVVTHEIGFHNQSEVMAHNAIAPHYDLAEVWPRFARRPLSPEEAAQLDAYLQARRRGEKDVAIYYPRLEEDQQALLQQLNLDAGRPVIAAFTNILWDSAVLDRNRAFADMTEWLNAVIHYATDHPKCQFVIRIHPAEVRLELRETRQRIEQYLHQHHPALPPNVRVVPPAGSLSSYALMQLCRVGLVYTSTVGLEMALQGIPVIVAGRTHYSDKGFTYEADTPTAYRQLLDRMDTMPRISAEQIELARRYAHLFFFRFMLPFPAVMPLERGRLRFEFDDLSALQPGADCHLDRICEGILSKQPFLVETLQPETHLSPDYTKAVPVHEGG